MLLLVFALAPACGGGNTGTGDGGGNDGSGGGDKVVGNCNGDCKDTEECVQGQFCLPKCGADETRCFVALVVEARPRDLPREYRGIQNFSC